MIETVFFFCVICGSNCVQLFCCPIAVFPLSLADPSHTQEEFNYILWTGEVVGRDHHNISKRFFWVSGLECKIGIEFIKNVPTENKDKLPKLILCAQRC